MIHSRNSRKSHLQYHSRGSKSAICHAGARQVNQHPSGPTPRPHDQWERPNPKSAMSESDAQIVKEGAYTSIRGLHLVALRPGVALQAALIALDGFGMLPD